MTHTKKRRGQQDCKSKTLGHSKKQNFHLVVLSGSLQCWICQGEREPNPRGKFFNGRREKSDQLVLSRSVPIKHLKLQHSSNVSVAQIIQRQSNSVPNCNSRLKIKKSTWKKYLETRSSCRQDFESTEQRHCLPPDD